MTDLVVEIGFTLGILSAAVPSSSSTKPARVKSATQVTRLRVEQLQLDSTKHHSRQHRCCDGQLERAPEPRMPGPRAGRVAQLQVFQCCVREN